MRESESEREVAQSCPTPSNPMDCSRLLHPWDFPGKSTGVGCHCLLRFFTLQPINEVREIVRCISFVSHSLGIIVLCCLTFSVLKITVSYICPLFFGGGVGCISKYGPCYSILAKSGSFCHLFKIFNCCDFFSHSQKIFTFLLYFLNWHCVFFFLKRAPILRFLR